MDDWLDDVADSPEMRGNPVRHTVSRRCPSYSDAEDEAEVEIDMNAGRAEVTVAGVIGPRTVSVLRTVFDAYGVFQAVKQPVDLTDDNLVLMALHPMSVGNRRCGK